MNFLGELWAGPVAQRLGWTLLHSLWQGAGVALLLALLLMRRRSAAARYGACCAALGLTLAVGMATFTLVRPAAPERAHARQPSREAVTIILVGVPEAPPAGVTGGPQNRQGPLEEARVSAALRNLAPKKEDAPGQDTVGGAGNATGWEQISRGLEPWLPGLTGVWSLGVTGLSIWHFAGFLGLRRLTRVGVRPLAGPWPGRVALLAQRLNVRRPLRLLESALADVPGVVGWWRPVVLVPVSVLTELPAEQLEAILAHELAHIRRHDYLINLIQTVVETLLFYHPAVWWMSRRLRQERENCCDDVAAEVCGDRLLYARALTALAELRQRQQTQGYHGLFGRGSAHPGVAASGGRLLPRIRRVVSQPTASGDPWRWPVRSWGAALLVAALLAVSGIELAVQAQSAPAPAPGALPASRPPRVGDTQMVPTDPGAPSTQPAAFIYKAQVVDRDGKPVAGAKIEVRAVKGEQEDKGEGVTDAQGRFHWSNKVSEKLLLDVSAIGFRGIGSREVTAGAGEQKVRLLKLMTVNGTVTDAVTKKPLAAFTAMPASSYHTPNDMTIECDRAKPFSEKYSVEFPWLYPLNWVYVEAPGHKPALSRVLTDEEGTVTVDLALEPAKDLTALVLGLDGQPASGAEVHVREVGDAHWLVSPFGQGLDPRGPGPMPARLKTGADGRFTLPNSGQPLRVAVLRADGYAVATSMDLAKSERITLKKWGRIEGSLSAALGTAAGQLIIVQSFADRDDWRAVTFRTQATTDAAGHFIVDYVPPGKVYVAREVRLEKPYSGLHVDDHALVVDVGEGQTVPVQLGGHGVAVRGAVVPIAGLDFTKVLSYAQLTVSNKAVLPAGFAQWSPEEQQKWTRSPQGRAADAELNRLRWRVYVVPLGPDGTFVIPDVPAGKYMLGVSVTVPYPGPGWGGGKGVGSIGREIEIPADSKETMDLGSLPLQLSLPLGAVPATGPGVKWAYQQSPDFAISDQGITLIQGTPGKLLTAWVGPVKGRFSGVEFDRFTVDVEEGNPYAPAWMQGRLSTREGKVIPVALLGNGDLAAMVAGITSDSAVQPYWAILLPDAKLATIAATWNALPPATRERWILLVPAKLDPALTTAITDITNAPATGGPSGSSTTQPAATQAADASPAGADKLKRFEDVQALLKRAAELRKEGKDDRALELAEQALHLDPGNAAAQAMKAMMQDSIDFLQFEKARTAAGASASRPFNDLVKYPYIWPAADRTMAEELAAEKDPKKRLQLEVVLLGNRAAVLEAHGQYESAVEMAQRAAALDPASSLAKHALDQAVQARDRAQADAAAAEKLRQRVPINFDTIHLDNALEFLRTVTSLNFDIQWVELGKAGIKKETPVTLKLTNVPVEQTLKLMLQQASTNPKEPATYKIKSGIVVISTPTALRGPAEIRVYDIRDFLVTIPDYKVPRIWTAPGEEDGDGPATAGAPPADNQPAQGSGPTREELLKALMNVVQTTAGRPDDWKPGGPATLQEYNGNLVVKAPEDIHADLIRVFTQLREGRGLQITIEARFGRLTAAQDDAFRKQFENELNAGGTAGPALPGHPGADGPWPLNDEQVARMVAFFKGLPDEANVSAPRLTIFNGQRAFAATISQAVPLLPNLTTAQAPVPVAFESGSVLGVMGSLSADRKYLTLDLEPRFTKLLDAGTARFEEASLHSVVSIPDRGTMLLRLPVKESTATGVKEVVDQATGKKTYDVVTVPAEKADKLGYVYLLVKPTFLGNVELPNDHTPANGKDREKDLNELEHPELRPPATQPAGGEPGASTATTQPALPGGFAVAKQAEQLVVQALSAHPVDEHVLRQVLRQAVQVEVYYFAEGERALTANVATRPDPDAGGYRLVRDRAGEVPQEWIDMLKAPLAKRPKPEARLVLAVPEALRAERDRALAEADEHLRVGLVHLAEKFPFMTDAPDWKKRLPLTPPVATVGRLSFKLFHLGQNSKVARSPNPVPEGERFSILAVARPPDNQPDQAPPPPIFRCLGLEGQFETSAGNVELREELEKLLAEALAPLRELDNRAAAMVAAQFPAPAPGAPEPGHWPASQPEAALNRVRELIRGAPVSINVDKLEIFELVPGTRSEYRLRSDVQQIGIAGVKFTPTSETEYTTKVFDLPRQGRFYIEHEDGIGASTQHYYGPFAGDPVTVLGLQR